MRVLRALVIATAVLLTATVAYARLAPLDDPATRIVVPGSVVLDSRGTVLARNASDGLRIPVPLSAIAPHMLEATISAEDQRFLRHPGVDPLAVARALTTLGTRPSGASTITQQLARRLYLATAGEPLLVRKLDEARIALMLEARFSKAEILDLYLNDVYYGRGAYGVEAAARLYFGTSAANLDLAHAAYLAGLPQRPTEYGAAADAEAVERQAYVLERMVADGWVSADDAAVARAERIDAAVRTDAAIAPHFVAYALAELARVRPDLARRDGLVIETTLDAGLETEIERLARLRLAPLAGRNVTDGALVAIEPGSGRIVAFMGSATDGDARHGGDIDMAVTPRQPGSALKPFLYGAAFERGYTAATPLLDVPTTFQTADATYSPLDYDRSFHGVVPLRTALASSLNIPAVRTLDAIGLDAMLEILHRFGLDTLDEPERYGLSLTLGGGEVRLLDLTSAYAALAAGGTLTEPYAVARVRDTSGRVLYEHAPAPARRVLSPQHAYLLTDILSDPDARIPGFGGVTPFDLPFAAAVKSGTSTAFRDNWTVGYTPDLAVGVWVGNADGSPMSDVSGVEGAGPLWHDAMLAAALARPMSPFTRPPGLEDVTVCAPTGLLPGRDCPSRVRELFVRGTAPTAVERYYVRDASGELRIDPPLEARPWAQDAGLALVARDGGSPALRIASPADGTVVYRAPELATDDLVLRAAASAGIARVTFSIDGAIVGEAEGSDPAIRWTLEPGTHVVVARAHLADGSAVTASASFEVK